MKKFQSLSVVYLLMGGAVITSCTDDKTIQPDKPVAGETAVRITVLDENMGTRAYTGTEDAIDGEVELASTLSLYVYDKNGTYEHQIAALPVNANRQTDIFKVADGEKYFYIFSNAQASPVAATSNMLDMEKQIINVDFDQNRPVPAALHAAMAIGTLWRGDDELTGNLRNIEGNRYGGQPVPIGLNVGRAVAKVRLTAVDKGTSSPLLGTFSNPIYRLRSIPVKYFLVGQLDGTGNYPPTTGLRYFSAVHTEDPGTAAIPSTQFVDYFWEGAFAPAPAQPATYDHYYAVENTTQMMESQNVKENHLYYGNTTYVQLRIVYAPGVGEVYDPAAPTTALGTDLPAGTTFWTAIHDGELKIFNSDPEQATDPTIFDETKIYENGVMYYKFPVRDPREIGTERQCCVIRNHYYEITVNNIFNLGEPTDEVDPEKPIDPTETDVEITVKVEPWYKVVQGEDL